MGEIVILRLFTFLLLSFTSVIGYAQASQLGVVERRNIDDLSTDELDAYLHAVQILKERSEKNVYDPEGYLWQAWVHNCPSVHIPDNYALPLNQQNWPSRLRCRLMEPRAQSDSPGKGYDDHWQKVYIKQRGDVANIWTPSETQALAKLDYPGECQHHSDIFFQWHRAEFYYYEKLLQSTDPEGMITDNKGRRIPTKNVAVPFWNFTQTPSGKRFPKAFEDPSSPLYIVGRNPTSVTAGSMPSYTSPYLLRYLLDDDWHVFGGRPHGSALNTVILNEGAYEAKIHDWMHFDYINGPMKSPSTAALDPIFYSFHAFVDMHYQKWLSITGHDSRKVTSPKRRLRGQQPSHLPNPEGYRPSKHPRAVKDMGSGDLYFDIRKLGYTYGKGLESEFLSATDVEQQLSGLRFGLSATSPLIALFDDRQIGEDVAPVFIESAELTLPASTRAAIRHVAAVTRAATGDDYSYWQKVYLHPRRVTAAIKGELALGGITGLTTKPLMSKYLVSADAYWRLGVAHLHHSHTGGSQSLPPSALNADVSWAVDSVVKQRQLDPQSISADWAVTVAVFSRSAQVHKSHFSGPNIDEITQ